MAKKTLVNRGLDKAAGLAVNDDGSLHPKAQGAVERVLSVQRPVVLAYLRSMRRRHPEATPAELAKLIEKQYVRLTMTGGAAVGATAVVPGIGTGAALGLAAVETGGFLEGSALYAQAIAELHGLPVRDPVRANALVMGLMLGSAGRDLVQKFSQQARGQGPALTSHWGAMVTKQIPNSMVEMLTKRMRKAMIRKYAARTGGSLIGRVLPFGIGAVIGGAVNRTMAKKVVTQAHEAFGELPTVFPLELDPQASTPKKDASLVAGLKNLMKLKKAREKARQEGSESSDATVSGEVIPERGPEAASAADATGARSAAGQHGQSSGPEAPKTHINTML